MRAISIHNMVADSKTHANSYRKVTTHVLCGRATLAMVATLHMQRQT